MWYFCKIWAEFFSKINDHKNLLEFCKGFLQNFGGQPNYQNSDENEILQGIRWPQISWKILPVFDQNSSRFRWHQNIMISKIDDHGIIVKLFYDLVRIIIQPTSRIQWPWNYCDIFPEFDSNSSKNHEEYFDQKIRSIWNSCKLLLEIDQIYFQ